MFLIQATWADDLVDRLAREFMSSDHVPVATAHLRVGSRSLDVSGAVTFVGAPGLPDYFGIEDHRGTLHLLKADPRLLQVTTGREAPCATLDRGVNHLLECGTDFARVLRDPSIGDELRAHGFAAMIDDLTRVSDRRPHAQFIIWAASAVGVMAYFVALDSVSELYVGRVGPRVIMDHFSSVAGSAAMVTSGVAFTSANENRNRFIRYALAAGATGIHFVIENPLGLASLNAIRFNVADPIDFWSGAVAAFGLAAVPDAMLGVDYVRRLLARRAQRRACLRALEGTT